MLKEKRSYVFPFLTLFTVQLKISALKMQDLTETGGAANKRFAAANRVYN